MYYAKVHMYQIEHGSITWDLFVYQKESFTKKGVIVPRPRRDPVTINQSKDRSGTSIVESRHTVSPKCHQNEVPNFGVD